MLNLAALIILFLIIKNVRHRNEYVSILLSFLWIWCGVVYHIIFFAEINPAAYGFGALFVLQGILLLLYGVVFKKLSFVININLFSITGTILILYALIIYPVIGILSAHSYPNSPTFGLPCPTTIFTFGVLILAEKKMFLPLLVIPFLWSLLGFSAAVNFSIYEDIGLPIAGIISIVVYFLKKRKHAAELKAA
jgi:hypothetical protein